MNREPETPESVGTHGDATEDTVELQLTAAEQLELARAGEAALGPSPRLHQEPGYDTFICERSHRADILGTVIFTAFVCLVTTAVGWHALGSDQRPAPPVVTAVPPPSIPVRSEPLRAMMQVPNPFDATEVFEVPAETSDADAKNAIASLLLERAQERRQQGLPARRASGHHPQAGPPIKPSDVYVTKVFVSTNRFSDTPGPSGGVVN